MYVFLTVPALALIQPLPWHGTPTALTQAPLFAQYTALLD